MAPLKIQDEDFTLESFPVRDVREMLADNRNEAGRWFVEFMKDRKQDPESLASLTSAWLVTLHISQADKYAQELKRRGRKVPLWDAETVLRLVPILFEQMKAEHMKNENLEKLARMEFNEGDVIRARSFGITLL